jgi:hypothetical protein
MGKEKRRFERYVFPNNDRIIALLATDNGGGNIKARILNISQGGLGLVVERTKIDSLKEEAVLSIKEIAGKGLMTGLEGHSVKVKWILDYEPLNNLAIGCEFIDLNEECRLEIDTLLIPD